MEQPQIELIVRLTARMSAAAFAAALLLFAVGHRHRRGVRHGIRLFVAFILAHTIHFGAVAWLGVLTAGENIRAGGGWAVVLAVAVLFYLAAFGIMRVWRNLGSDRLLSRRDRLIADVAVALIALVFLNSYLARVGRMSAYWLPAIGMVVIVAIYFAQMRVAATPVESEEAPQLR